MGTTSTRSKRKLCCSINPEEGRKKCRECLIRSRRSYTAFADRIPKITNMAEALIAIWDEVDNHRGWKSHTTASKVLESIKLLIEDRNLDKVRVG